MAMNCESHNLGWIYFCFFIFILGIDSFFFKFCRLYDKLGRLDFWYLRRIRLRLGIWLLLIIFLRFALRFQLYLHLWLFLRILIIFSWLFLSIVWCYFSIMKLNELKIIKYFPNFLLLLLLLLFLLSLINTLFINLNPFLFVNIVLFWSHVQSFSILLIILI